MNERRGRLGLLQAPEQQMEAKEEQISAILLLRVGAFTVAVEARSQDKTGVSFFLSFFYLEDPHQIRAGQRWSGLLVFSCFVAVFLVDKTFSYLLSTFGSLQRSSRRGGYSMSLESAHNGVRPPHRVTSPCSTSL